MLVLYAAARGSSVLVLACFLLATYRPTRNSRFEPLGNVVFLRMGDVLLPKDSIIRPIPNKKPRSRLRPAHTSAYIYIYIYTSLS